MAERLGSEGVLEVLREWEGKKEQAEA